MAEIKPREYMAPEVVNLVSYWDKRDGSLWCEHQSQLESGCTYSSLALFPPDKGRLISLRYLHVDDRAEFFLTSCSPRLIQAIMQIPGENYTRFSWFYEFHLGKIQKHSQTHGYSLPSCERGGCESHFMDSGLLPIQLFVINNIWSSCKVLI